MIVIIFLASSMKAIYYLYLIIIPIVIYKSKVNFSLNLKTILSHNYFIFKFINKFNNKLFFYRMFFISLLKKLVWLNKNGQLILMKLNLCQLTMNGGPRQEVPGYKSEVSREDYIKNLIG